MSFPTKLNSLSCLRYLPEFDASKLPAIEKKKKVRRRGHRGHKCGRGNSPQHHNKLGFEGGNTPFWRLIPKFGKPAYKKEYFEVVNIGKLQVWIDQGRINPNNKITMKTLQDSKLCEGIKYGVKLLGDGAAGFVSKIDIEVSAASSTAIQAVEKNGGLDSYWLFSRYILTNGRHDNIIQ